MVDGLLSWGCFLVHWEWTTSHKVLNVHISNLVGRRPSPVKVKATPGQKAIHHHTRTSSLQSKKLTCKKQQHIQQQQEHRTILKYRDCVKNTQPQHLQVIIIC